MKGIFITFEGPDGAGKTTQLRLLAEYLQQLGHDVIITREPGGTQISDMIRAMLLDPDNQMMVSQTEVLLYAASRAQHIHERIIPSLDNGSIVLCDRFIDASIAYQAYGLGIDIELVQLINQYASSGLQPDRTYLLDLPVDVSFYRLAERGRSVSGVQLDRIEQRDFDYHNKVREGFLEIEKNDPKRILRVNANSSIDEIAAIIVNDFTQLLLNIGR